jgi:Protein of unknown function (DUF3703)
MNTFAARIAPHVAAEVLAARAAESRGDPAASFHHLERAHVLGQPSTLHHVRVHAAMLAWAWRQGCVGEVAGQVLRIVGAATMTAIGLVPTGNTGGSNVSPFQPLPVPEDLAALIRGARSPR